MTQVDLDINVHHVTRVEGHGNITVNVRQGTIEKCQWEVVEAPRFFEAMARGRDYTEMAHLTSRICFPSPYVSNVALLAGPLLYPCLPESAIISFLSRQKS